MQAKIKNCQGFAHILILILLIVGIVVGLILLKYPQIFRPKASVDPIIFEGSGVSRDSSGNYLTNRLDDLKIKLTSPINPPQSYNPIADTPGTVMLGATVNSDLSSPNNKNVLLTYGFKSLTSENDMKMTAIWPNGSANYQFGAADTIAGFARDNNIRMHGHALIYGDATPDWLKNAGLSKPVLEDQMNTYIQKVLGHFKTSFPNTFRSWDVVNEAIDPYHPSDGNNQFILANNVWNQTIGIESSGDNYVDIAFRDAHAADPSVKLFYNERVAEAQNPVSDALYNMVKRMLSRGVPIDGVGFQTHIATATNLDTMTANLKRFTDLGLEVRLSEVDVYDPENNQDHIKATYGAIAGVCKANPKCTGFTTWGLTDNSTWLRGQYNTQNIDPLLFDKAYQPKPAYFSVMTALALPLPQPDGTISVSPTTCTGSCTVTLTWSAQKTGAVDVRKYFNYVAGDLGESVSTSLSGSVNISIPPGHHYFNLFNMTSPASPALIKQAEIQVNNTPVVAPPPVVPVTPPSGTITASQTSCVDPCSVNVTWSAQNTNSASVYSFLDYDNNPQGVLMNGSLSGSQSIQLKVGKNYFNLFNGTTTGGALLGQARVDVSPPAPVPSPVVHAVPVFRLYLASQDVFYYTTTASERDGLVAGGWSYDPGFGGAGYVYTTPQPGTVPVYVLYERANGNVHYYTSNQGEANNLNAGGWVLQGIIWYAYPNQQPGTTVVYRLYNTASDHFYYTTDAGEKNSLSNSGQNTTGWIYDPNYQTWYVKTNVLGISVQAAGEPYTTAYRIAEDPDSLASASWQQYTQDSMIAPFTFKDQNPGTKTVFVEFKGGNGESQKAQASIAYLPLPASPQPPSAQATSQSTTQSTTSSNSSDSAPATTTAATTVANTMADDLNKDGSIDIFDYKILTGEYINPGSGLKSDLNSDGKIDLFDYNIFIKNFLGN